MTPETQASELVNSFMTERVYVCIKQGTQYKEYYEHMALRSAKVYALMCVDKILNTINYMNEYNDFPKIVLFWNDVKNEIHKL